MENNHIKVLIVGGGLQAVSTARSLKEEGFIVGCWCAKDNLAHKSSAIDIKGFSSDDESDSGNLINFIKQNTFDVAIPMNDKYAIGLSQMKEELSQKTNCKIAVPDYSVLEIAANKVRLMELCQQYNFPHPQTISVDNCQSIEKEDLKFPLLIKPNHSVGARGITRVNNYKELQSALPNNLKHFGNCHLQEFIENARPYYNVMIYRDTHGKCINSVILEIIRFFPLEGGSSSMCRTILNEELTKLCMDVLGVLHYIGFADFDILKTQEDEYRIIEINPRVPASLRGASISGINFPAIIVNDLLGRKIESYVYSPGKILRFLGLDIMWFMTSNERFQCTPSWFKLIGKNIYYQEGGLKDLKPMLYSLFSNLKKIEFRDGKLRKKKDKFAYF